MVLSELDRAGNKITAKARAYCRGCPSPWLRRALQTRGTKALLKRKPELTGGTGGQRWCGESRHGLSALDRRNEQDKRKRKLRLGPRPGPTGSSSPKEPASKSSKKAVARSKASAEIVQNEHKSSPERLCPAPEEAMRSGREEENGKWESEDGEGPRAAPMKQRKGGCDDDGRSRRRLWLGMRKGSWRQPWWTGNGGGGGGGGGGALA